MPRVSVVIPSYNRAHLIGEAIESVLNQTFKDLEIIIVDDGSTDNTKEVVGCYNGPIRYIYQENRGLSDARNPGIIVADGEYMAFVDSDDLWLPEKLERQVELLDSQPQIGLVYSDYRFVDSRGDHIAKPRIYERTPLRSGRILGYLMHFDFIHPSTVMVRKSCLDQVGLFDTTLKLGTDDFDLWIRVAKRYDISYVDAPLALIRQHGNNWSSEELERGTVDVLLKHLRLDDTREALGKEWREVYRHSYLTVANYYYNRRDMRNARRYFLESLRASPYGRLDLNILNLIFRTLLGRGLLDTARQVRNVFAKVIARS